MGLTGGRVGDDEPTALGPGAVGAGTAGAAGGAGATRDVAGGWDVVMARGGGCCGLLAGAAAAAAAEEDEVDEGAPVGGAGGV